MGPQQRLKALVPAAMRERLVTGSTRLKTPNHGHDLNDRRNLPASFG